MSESEGRRKPHGGTAPRRLDIIGWLSQQATPISVHTSRYSTAAFYYACISRLGHIWKQVQRGSSWAKEDKIRLRENFGRFHLWGEGLPLHVLDDADDQFEETRNLVLELLCNVSGLLSKVLDLLPGVDNGEVVLLDEYTAIARKLLPAFNKDDVLPLSESLAPDGDNSVILSISCWLDEFDFYLDCLNDLAPTIGSAVCADELSPLGSAEVSANNTKSTKVTNHSTLELERAQSHFIRQVRDKFPRSSETLAQRLGKANWNRFKLLRQEKSQVQEDSGFVRPALPASSKFHDSGIGTSMGRQSAHDESTLSHTSFASTAVEGETAHFRVPPTPAEVVQGKPFGCSICSQTLSLKNRVAWKMHVFADLQAYTCTFKECLGNQGPFPQRSTWADHELREHFTKKVWMCTLCKQSETSAGDYITHFQNAHKFSLEDKRLGKYLQGDQITSLKPVNSQPCPLCLKGGWSSYHSYFSHVGRHLEEIALVVLPQDVDEEESDLESCTSRVTSNSESLETSARSSSGTLSGDLTSFQAAGTGPNSSSRDKQRKKGISKWQGMCLECKKAKKRCDGGQMCGRCHRKGFDCIRSSTSNTWTEDDRQIYPTDIPSQELKGTNSSAQVNKQITLETGRPITAFTAWNCMSGVGPAPQNNDESGIMGAASESVLGSQSYSQQSTGVDLRRTSTEGNTNVASKDNRLQVPCGKHRASRPNRRGPWLPDEDETLLQLVCAQGPNNWVRISQHMQHRSPKQCRERYHQNLKPSLNHEPISSQEGELIELLVNEMGKRWGEIAQRLGNRSDNAVKNWWNGSMNRRKHNVEQHGHWMKGVDRRPLPALTTRRPGLRGKY